MTLPVLVINRAVDVERLSAFNRSADRIGFRPVRVPAFDGHRPDFPFWVWRDLMGESFWGSNRIKPGALACWLSHRRAWLRVVDAGWPAALICEDDADLVRDPAHAADVLRSLPAADVVFANDRMAAGLAAGAAAVTVDDAAAAAVQQGTGFPADGRAPGADCYLVTLEGAKRLLRMTAQARICCGVDWAMVWHALTSTWERCAAAPELSALAAVIPPADRPLRAWILAEPLAVRRRGVPSAIRHRQTRPIAEIRHVPDPIRATVAVGHGASRT